MISRRTLLATSAGALAAGLAPLAPARGRDVPGPVLRLWTTETEPARQRVIEYLMGAFGAWSGLPVPVVMAIAEDDMTGAMASARRTGSLPDLVNTGGDLLLALHRAGLLDADAAAEMVAEAGDIFPGAAAALQGRGGAQAAIPFHGWPQVLWYRRDLFESAGLPPPDTPQALLTAAQALHEGPQGRVGIVCGTDGGLYTQQVFAQLVRAVGGALFAADGTPTLDTPAVHEALALHAALAAAGPPGVNDWRARDWYIQGRAAMLAYSTFIMDDLAIAAVAANSLEGGRFEGLEGAAFDVGLVGRTDLVTTLQPAGAGYAVVNGIAVCTGREAERRAAALDLIRFLFRPDSTVVWLHMAPGGMLPVRRGIAGSEGFLRDPMGVFRRFGRERLSRLAQGLDAAAGFAHWHGTIIPEAPTVHADGLVGRMVTRVVTGAEPPAASARRAQTEAEALLRG